MNKRSSDGPKSESKRALVTVYSETKEHQEIVPIRFQATTPEPESDFPLGSGRVRCPHGNSCLALQNLRCTFKHDQKSEIEPAIRRHIDLKNQVIQQQARKIEYLQWLVDRIEDEHDFEMMNFEAFLMTQGYISSPAVKEENPEWENVEDR